MKMNIKLKDIKINDSLHNFMLQNILKLNFVHFIDKKQIALEMLKENNAYGFYLKNDGFNWIYNLIFPYSLIQKGKETILEIFSYFIHAFEKLGVYLTEFSSINENNFYLLTKSDKIYFPFVASIKNGYIHIQIKDLFYIFKNNIPPLFNPYKFAYVIQNNNRTEMIKKDQELKLLNGYKLQSKELEKQILEAKELNLNEIVVTSISLIKKQKYRILQGDNFSKVLEINSSDLVNYLAEINENVLLLNYKNNLKETMTFLSNNLVENYYICSSCLVKQKKQNLLKPLWQRNKLCSFCKQKTGMHYFRFEKTNYKS